MLPIRIYRTLLWCYPAPFRREYGAEMTGSFADLWRDARRQGGLKVAASIWIETLLDVLFTAPMEHYHVIQQDLKYAFRTLAAKPGFAAVAILSLALGIGANTAIYSLLDSVLLSSLPVRDPQSLVLLTDRSANGVSVGTNGGERALLTHTEFVQLRDQNSVFSSMTACQSALERLQARVNGGELEATSVRMVSAGYFGTLGVSAVLGRTFTERDEAAAAHAVISYDYWQRRFGGREDVLGAKISIRGGVFSVAGVAPASFFGETVGEQPDAWLPLSLQQIVLPGRDWLHDKPGTKDKVMWLHVFGRLKPGVSIEKAQAGVDVIFQQALLAFYGPGPNGQVNFGQHLKLKPGGNGVSQVRGQFGEPLTILLAAAGVVFLIACANLGNLMLARSMARTREISVRLALGAGRSHLIRQMITESMVLAFFGGIAGLAAAWILRAGLIRLVSDTIHVPTTPDLRVLGFAFLLTLAAGLILGILPALRTGSVNASSGLKEQGRGLTSSATWMRAGKLVVIGQIVLSLPLLVGSGLLMQTLYNLQRVDLGYAKESLLMVRVDIETGGYAEHLRQPLIERLLQRVQATPGVRAASYSKSGLFLGSDSSDNIAVDGYVPTGDEDDNSRNDHVGPGFFSTLGIPILAGREITEQDQASSKRVCVINESFAKKFLAGRNPLGVHIKLPGNDPVKSYEIVGVARNSRKRSLRGEVETRFFVPSTQPIDIPRFVTYAVRTTGDPKNVLASVRRSILLVDPNLPIPMARPLSEFIEERITQDRLLARLSMAFGVAALLLAAMGLYGVLSYGVARRTNEIGIRKALGAAHGDVVGMILRETAVVLVVGFIGGIALSAAGLQLISSRLFGLAPTDPVAFGGGVALLATVAFIAAWLPAYRASRVDPVIALRYE